MRNLLIIVAILPFFAFQCDKQKIQNCVKGKVIRVSCASYVVQVLNRDDLGEDQWKDSTGDGAGASFDNVFNVSNKCKIPGSYKAGDIIYFSIDKPTASDCVVCTMYDAPPKTQYEVIHISSKPCD